MPRRYKVTFENVAVSLAQDMVQLQGAAGKMARILRWWVACTDQTPTAQMLQTRCRFLPATVTNGSGGTTPTPQKVDPGDAAASVTALVNNTTKATTSGTAVILEEDACHIMAGLDKATMSPPLIGPSEAFVFELLAAPASAIHLSGGIEVEEMGG